MPPTDASADAGTAAVTECGPAPADQSGTRPSPDAGEGSTGTSDLPGTDAEDTLDLRLPDEFIALLAKERADAEKQTDVYRQADADEQADAGEQVDAGEQADVDEQANVEKHTDAYEQADAGGRTCAHAAGRTDAQVHTHAGRRADALERAEAGRHADTEGKRSRGADAPPSVSSTQTDHDLLDHDLLDHDLLDRVADWGPTVTPVGLFQFVPVSVERDLPLISHWMNDPAVAAFWGLGGSQNATEDHVWAQLAGDGRSIPCLGVLEGTPMSYWEIYRADLDPLARHYPARPHDTGIHLLIGGVADRGRGLGSALLRAVADLALDKRPACARVIAEPDLRNTPSVAAFLSAGFRFSAEIELPAKRAALMVRDRSLRDLL